jgi:catechol 2,3-dioxygenase-like lactoylglutathione lyase family enzyme
MTITHVFAGLPVTDLDAALDWYERLLGGPPAMLPNESEAVWQLGETALIYVVDDEERAGNGLLALIVDDLDAVLAGTDLQPESVEPVAGVGREALFLDPDGNAIKFAQLE